MGASTEHTAVGEGEIRAALLRLLSSSELKRSPQLQRFLSFTVNEALNGRNRRLKEYTIGVEVFGRPASYDPRLDSLVRVEAKRLRALLDQYYASTGNSDPVRIDLPRGSYNPVFHVQSLKLDSDNPSSILDKRRLWLWPAIAAALLLCIGGIVWALRANSHSAPSRRTIAVLPFENLSSDAENEYLCFGMMDEVTTNLAEQPTLRVIARTSSSRFKRGDDIAKIARELKADAILEGSVSKWENRVRVTAQLINASDSVHLWAENFEREGKDPLVVQNEVSREIANAVVRRLIRNSSAEQYSMRYSSNPEANRLYWKGLYLRAPMGRTNWRNDLTKSAEYLENAVRTDDRFAQAYAALADVYVSLGWERGGGPMTRELMTRGRLAAERALALDETLAEAYGALGTIQFFFDYAPIAAEKSFQRALELNPNDGKARMWYAYALAMQRRSTEAIAQASQARELDPLSFTATTHLAVVCYFSRNYDEAMRLVNETSEVADTAPVHGLRGMILESNQNYSEAIVEYQAGLRIVPTHPYIKGMLGHAYAMSGQKDRAVALLRDARLPFEQGGLTDLKLAYIYIGLGEQEVALQHLERDYDERDPELPYINADPVFDPVRNHPRFTALLVKMGLSR